MKLDTHKYTNDLINESSPYLLQHAHNPVNWYPWGEKALNKAKKENKLILISIGYSACHWCHVMERESFENEAVANLMNKYFVSIKVDREERPDIDQIYMTAVQLMSGSGGWPLNCFALPDGRPIFGGTYFPPQHWEQVLSNLAKSFEAKPEKFIKVAEELEKGINDIELISEKADVKEFSTKDLEVVVSKMSDQFDKNYGGYLGAPKFPMPNNYQFLLHHYYHTKDNSVLEHVIRTLDKMANGGIYDQIGGGFARYSTDKEWKVPHFEKMLYDNAQFVSLYSQAYQLTKTTSYKRIVFETLEFIKREMTSLEGGFYSSIDADSEGQEGRYYVWTRDEIKEVLGKDAYLIINYFNVSDEGNWENGKNILFINETLEIIAARYKISVPEFANKLNELKSGLLKERAKRVYPGLDNKIITSWNALMMKGYIDAYKAFGNEEYLNTSIKNADFIVENLLSNDFSLKRNYKNAKSSIDGFLDDYSFTISAFISLYQVTFDEKWLSIAKNLTDYAIEHFLDKKSEMFYYTSDLSPELITRKMEISDNVIPASNSEMARTLNSLGIYYYDENYNKIAKQMLFNILPRLQQNGVYNANWAILLSSFIYEPFEVVIAGKNAIKKRKELDNYYLPNVVLAGGKQESNLKLLEDRFVNGQTIIYVCKNRICKMPVTKISDAIKLIEEK